MDENEHSKTELWTERIQDFYASGLSRKEWCREHQIPQSTLGYWIRKQKKDPIEPAPEKDPVFARLLSEQEISSGLLSMPGRAPVSIHLPGSVRIEIDSGCPAGLLASLFQVLKAHN